MGDENSLQGRTQAHKHSAASSDGSFLSTGVTGVTNLSHGSIMYGDASEIVTELPVSSDGDVLELSSGVPAWVTPAGGSNYTFLGSASATTSSPITVSFTAEAPPNFIIAVFAGTPAGSQEVAFQVNGITSSDYANQGFYQKSGTQTLRNVSGNDKFYGIDSGISGHGVAYAKFFVNPVDEKIYMSTESYTENSGGAWSSMGGYLDVTGQTDITSITCLGNPFTGTLSCWAVRN